MSILLLIIGLLIGAIGAYLFLNGKSSSMVEENRRLSNIIASKNTETELLNKRIDDIRSENALAKAEAEARYEREKVEESQRRDRQLKEQLTLVEEIGRAHV